MSRAAASSSRALAGAWRLARALLCVGALAGAAAAFGADEDKVIFPGGSAQNAAPAATTASVANSLTLILGVALAGVGGWFVWRNRQRTAGGRVPNLRALAIDETRSLGNRQYLVVASYEGKRFLLGVCPGRIDMLTSLDAAAARAKAAE